MAMVVGLGLGFAGLFDRVPCEASFEVCDLLLQSLRTRERWRGFVNHGSEDGVLRVRRRLSDEPTTLAMR